MNALAPTRTAFHFVASAVFGDACPKCGSDGLVRVHQRPLARLVGALTGVRYVRCSNLLCGYEGSLRR
jgi:hypothetical protein